ncbi:MAG: endonuclease III [Methylohalobius sp.]
MNQHKRRQIFERLAQAIPNPTSELKYRTPFELLVAVVLSAQATDKSVNQATEQLFRLADTPQKLLALGEDKLKQIIRHIGLYNHKAKNLINLAKQLVERHGGQVPRTRKELEALPGVGRKTANVVLNTAFGEPTIAVDTHVFRVCNRTGLAPGKTVRQVEEKLNRVTPPKFKRVAHHLLILLGRYICTARAPQCTKCPIVELCEYPHKCLTDSQEVVSIPVGEKAQAADRTPGG